MFLGAPNPIQIQLAPLDEGKPRLPPLILVHDSTGTTVSYFALRDLERDVWAIHDPNHWEATAWEGGVDDMASYYVQLVKAAGILGPVILGGRF
jgi:pimeloyl-ACP methyl ester carboxylesterase